MRGITRRGAIGATSALALAFGLAACSGSGPASAPSSDANRNMDAVEQRTDMPESLIIDRILERGSLVVGMPEDVRGFTFLDPLTGEYTGFESDLANGLAEYILGEAAVEHVTVTTDTRESLLQNGTVDVVLATYQITEPRLEKINFAGPHMVLGSALVSTTDWDGEISSAEDLDGLRIITTAGAAADYLSTAAPEATPVVFDSLSACIQALKDGRGDLFLNNGAVAVGLVAGDDELALAGEFDPANYGIGTPKGDDVFTEVVNDYLTQIIDDGSWASSWDANVGVFTGRDTPEAPKVGALFIE